MRKENRFAACRCESLDYRKQVFYLGEIMGERLNSGMEKVFSYIEAYTKNNFPGTAEAGILNSVIQPAGKMVRPRLMLTVAELGPKYEENQDLVCRLAALIEIVHAASLVHDDIVDDSPLRRGRMTVQRRFGKNEAVYAGDFMLSRVAYWLMDPSLYGYNREIIRTTEKMCLGEITQGVWRYASNITVSQYMKIIYGKTAAIFETACLLASRASGCGEEEQRRMAEFGRNTGFLFQIRDDLLDFISTESELGKPVRRDFFEGIYTMPVLYALESHTYAEPLRLLLERNEAGSLSGSGIEELLRLVETAGGIDRTYEEMARCRLLAEKELEPFPDCRAKRILTESVCGLAAAVRQGQV